MQYRSPSDNEEIADYYSADLSVSTSSLVRGWLGLARIRQEILRLTKVGSMSIADIGGGSGTFAHWLARQGHSVSLLDFSPGQLGEAKRRESPSYPLLDYILGDARSLPWPDSTFDLALLLGPLYHLKSKQTRLEVLSEAVRVLKPRGIVVAETLNRLFPMQNLAWNLGDVPNASVASQILDKGVAEIDSGECWYKYIYCHAQNETVEEFDKAGLEVIEVIAVEGPWAYSPRALSSPTQDRIAASTLLDIAKETSRATESIAASPHILTVGMVR